MSDQKLRCTVAFRLDPGRTILLAKYDHANQNESHSADSLYGNRDKPFADAISAVIENDPPPGLAEAGSLAGFKVVQSDQHQVVYGADADKICLAVVTGLGYPSRVAIQMLQELYKEFHQKYASEASTASTDVFTKKAKGMLKEVCTKYDDLSKVDKTSSILSKVDEAKNSMQSNITNMLQNQEAAETLAVKSDQLNEQASVFKKRSTDLKKQMAWKDLKMTLILGGIVVVILIIIIVPLVNMARGK